MVTCDTGESIIRIKETSARLLGARPAGIDVNISLVPFSPTRRRKSTIRILENIPSELSPGDFISQRFSGLPPLSHRLFLSNIDSR